MISKVGLVLNSKMDMEVVLEYTVELCCFWSGCWVGFWDCGGHDGDDGEGEEGEELHFVY